MKATPIHPGRSYLVSGLGFEIPVLAKNGVLAICAILRHGCMGPLIGDESSCR